ncbi:MAG: hypothetical protein AAF481_15595 [Acidobacteriota bacterium]
MTSERRITWIVAAVATLALAAFLFGPVLKEKVAPEPVAAWVAIQPAGATAATLGPVDLAAGTSFRLHAVLEAKDGSESVFYTEAPALERAGHTLPAASVRPWDRRPDVRILWFTVEGAVPFLRIQPDQTLDRFRYAAFFRPEWGFGWSVPGILDPAHDARLSREDRQVRRPFGSQHYQVHIELRSDADAEVASERLVSWGLGEVQSRVEEFPRVVATLPGAAGPASAMFGLTQLELSPEAPPEARRQLAEWTGERLAFGRVPLLAEIYRSAGRNAAEVDWQRIDLVAGRPWDDFAVGDLLRVGDRFVTLFRDAADAGEVGVLDREDLCFDFAQGSAVRALKDVFEDLGGDVEWASMSVSGAPATP